MRSAIENRVVDFVITNPGSFAMLEMLSGVTGIATRVSRYGDADCDRVGAVVFTRSTRDDIRSIHDLKGKNILAAHKDSVTWLIARRLLREKGLDAHVHLSSVRFCGFPHDRVVQGVRDGLADAGVVWSGMLEQMAAAGEIRIEDYRVLDDRKGKAFPLHLSSDLYPEWPFAKARHAPDGLARNVALALFRLEKNHRAAAAAGISGWTTPYSYASLHALMREFRVGPYRDYGRISLGNFFEEYGRWIALSFFLLALSTVLAIAALVLSRRLHRSNRELRGSNALLEEKVEERTSELEMANRSLEEEIAERQAAEEEVRKVNSELSEKNDLLVSAIHELKAMNEEYEATNEALIASEQELIVSERKFRNLVESIRVGVIAYEPGKGIVIANRFAVELLKTSVEEMRNYTPNNSAWRLIRDDGSEMEPFEYPINTVLATREPLLNCTLGIRHPGSDRTVSTLISAFPEFDTSGILKQVVMTITDISELNELRRELIESRERFRSMVENINDLVCEVNGEREFTYASPVFFKQLGYRPEEIVGAKPSDILHPDDLDEARKRFANLMEKGGVSNDVWRIRHSDGRWLWMECSSSAVARSSGEKGIVIISRDITGRRMIEESLLQSEKKYKSLTQRMSDMLWTADLNLKTTYVSPSIEKVLGFTPEERMRQSIEEMVTPQSLERAFDALRREMEQEKKGVYRDRTVVIELDFYRKNGTIAVIESLVSLIRDEDGAVVGMQGISRDITERKRLEEESKINDLRVASLLKMSQQTYDSAEDVLWSALDAALVLSASAAGGVFFFNAERGVFSSSMF
jgi:PAS domain S-box-containing protein